jgi:hypothetical protein
MCIHSLGKPPPAWAHLQDEYKDEPGTVITADFYHANALLPLTDDQVRPSRADRATHTDAWLASPFQWITLSMDRVSHARSWPNRARLSCAPGAPRVSALPACALRRSSSGWSPTSPPASRASAVGTPLACYPLVIATRFSAPCAKNLGCADIPVHAGHTPGRRGPLPSRYRKPHRPAHVCGPAGAQVVDSIVLRYPRAVTHFSPGCYAHRPFQATSIPNVFMAGDYVKGLPHGANGLSQVSYSPPGKGACTRHPGCWRQWGTCRHKPGRYVAADGAPLTGACLPRYTLPPARSART